MCGRGCRACAPPARTFTSPGLPGSLTRAPARARSYNKQEADFATREEFYNYLEEREDISSAPHPPRLRSPAAAPPLNAQ